MIATMINGKAAEWTPEIKARWESFQRTPGEIVAANWFTARPHVDQYNRGSEEEGFTYTLKPADRPHEVWQISWRVGKPDAPYINPRRQL